MFQRLHGLICHADATRFEIEDGLVRHAPAALLAEETSVSSIVVDLGITARPDLLTEETDRETPVPEHNALILITADDEESAQPANLGDLVADVAIVGPSWASRTVDVAELAKPWLGAATPGPKISALFNPSGGVDSPQYRSDVQSLAEGACATFGDVGCRICFIDEGPAVFTTSISFWFASPQHAKDARATGGFEQLVYPTLIDSHSLSFVEAVEHVIVANPNIWSTTTGVEPPATN